MEHDLLRTDNSTLDDVNLAGLRHFAKQNFRSDPAGTPSRCCQRFALLNNVTDEEVLGSIRPAAAGCETEFTESFVLL